MLEFFTLYTSFGVLVLRLVYGLIFIDAESVQYFFNETVGRGGKRNLRIDHHDNAEYGEKNKKNTNCKGRHTRDNKKCCHGIKKDNSNIILVDVYADFIFYFIKSLLSRFFRFFCSFRKDFPYVIFLRF